MDEGMCPVRLFPNKFIVVKEVRVPMDEGMLPVSLFCEIPRKVNAVSMPIDGGMTPLKPLLLSASRDNLVR